MAGKDDDKPLTAAQQKLVTENRMWARDVVRRLARVFGAVLEPDDIAQLADMGLSRAARRWDTGTGVPFQGFALKFVRGAVTNAGCKEKRYYGHLAAAAEGWTEEGDLFAETDEDAREKLFARAKQGGAAMVLGALGRASHALAAGGEEAVFRKMAASRLPEALAMLKPRMREVVERRYFQGQEIKEIAGALGVAEITVRRDDEEGLDKLWRFFLLKAGIEL